MPPSQLYRHGVAFDETGAPILPAIATFVVPDSVSLDCSDIAVSDIIPELCVLIPLASKFLQSAASALSDVAKRRHCYRLDLKSQDQD